VDEIFPKRWDEKGNETKESQNFKEMYNIACHNE
jgi:hypothetical protein